MKDVSRVVNDLFGMTELEFNTLLSQAETQAAQAHESEAEEVILAHITAGASAAMHKKGMGRVTLDAIEASQALFDRITPASPEYDQVKKNITASAKLLRKNAERAHAMLASLDLNAIDNRVAQQFAAALKRLIQAKLTLSAVALNLSAIAAEHLDHLPTLRAIAKTETTQNDLFLGDARFNVRIFSANLAQVNAVIAKQAALSDEQASAVLIKVLALPDSAKASIAAERAKVREALIALKSAIEEAAAIAHTAPTPDPIVISNLLLSLSEWYCFTQFAQQKIGAVIENALESAEANFPPEFFDADGLKDYKASLEPQLIPTLAIQFGVAPDLYESNRQAFYFQIGQAAYQQAEYVVEAQIALQTSTTDEVICAHLAAEGPVVAEAWRTATEPATAPTAGAASGGSSGAAMAGPTCSDTGLPTPSSAASLLPAPAALAPTAATGGGSGSAPEAASESLSA